MSQLVVVPGQTLVLDPSDKRVIVFDWDDENLAASVQISTSTFSITAIRQAGATALTKDNESLLSAADATTALGRTVSVANRVARARLLATTATAGDEYEVAHLVITNESPAQQKQKSVRVVIEDL